MAKESRVRWIFEIAAASVISVLAVRTFDKYFAKKNPADQQPEAQQNPAMVGMQQQQQPQYLVAPPIPPPMPMPVPFPVYTAAPPQQPNFPPMPQFPQMNPQQHVEPEVEEIEEIIEEIDPVDEIEKQWEENGWDA